MKNEIIKHELSEEVIKYDDYIAGLAKGLTILEAFGTDRHRLNVTQVADRTGITKTATRRYLKTLKFLGYLHTDDYYYWLSHKVLKFSGAYLNTAHLPKVSQSILNFLAVRTTLIYSVVVLDEYEVVAISRSVQNEDNFRVSPFGIHLGNRIPAHASSVGQTLLAHKLETEQNNWLTLYPLKRFTVYTETDQEKFLAKLKKIKEQGYCISSEEYELGVTAIAVPVVNHNGDMVAGLNAVAPTSKVNEEYLLNTILPLLREAANELKALI